MVEQVVTESGKEFQIAGLADLKPREPKTEFNHFETFTICNNEAQCSICRVVGGVNPHPSPHLVPLNPQVCIDPPPPKKKSKIVKHTLLIPLASGFTINRLPILIKHTGRDSFAIALVPGGVLGIWFHGLKLRYELTSSAPITMVE